MKDAFDTLLSEISNGNVEGIGKLLEIEYLGLLDQARTVTDWESGCENWLYIPNDELKFECPDFVWTSLTCAAREGRKEIMDIILSQRLDLDDNDEINSGEEDDEDEENNVLYEAGQGLNSNRCCRS